MLKIAASIVIAIVGLAALVWPSDSGGATNRDATPLRAAAGGVVGAPDRGLAVQLNTGHSALDAYRPLLREIAGLGANCVLLAIAGQMEHAKSQSIFIDARKTPSRADLKTLLLDARQLGLRVTVMPILLLANPRGSEWRGVIEPPDWENWWGQYRDFVLYFADIANEGGAEALIIGSELVSTEKYTAQWEKTIAAVRQRFGGRLGYSANWDHYKPIQFWDKLDFVGMTSYYTLADKKNPTVDEIVARWKPIYDEVAAWQRQVNKPIVMTEVGWCSQEGAATAPWNYYQNQIATPAGHEEQRRLYEAFLKTWDGKPGIQGIIWWEWTLGAGGSGDYGYTPKGKPAEMLLRQWFHQNTAATDGGEEASR
jgi:hypothetical protein